MVIGAGPAGIAAAMELSDAGRPVVLLEQHGLPGGMSRTAQSAGYRFDLGGHRFFTKVPRISALWNELLKEDFLVRDRLSRVHYRGRFFSYPLKPAEVISKLGLVSSCRIGLSYLMAKLRPRIPEDSFEKWVSNRFGTALYDIRDSSYTEKVWGRPCSEISPDWAAQRIKNLSLSRALWKAVFPQRGPAVTSLIEQFRYPRLGPGMMWEACCGRILKNGGQILYGARVTRVTHDNGIIRSVGYQAATGEEKVRCDHLISTLPLADLVQALDTPAPKDVKQAAASLTFRGFLTVALVVEGVDLFPDNWIYVHDPGVQVGRIQNFRNWSPNMMPNDRETSIGMEYFCDQDDEFWSQDDGYLVKLATRELEHLGLVPGLKVTHAAVVRASHAYPVYDPGYRERLDEVRRYLLQLPNLQTCGRNGLHRYNNMDHSMLTGLYAAENIMGQRRDLWQVNAEQDYLEEEG